MKQRLFTIISITLSFLIVLAFAEGILRLKTHSIRTSERMQDGLLMYDEHLGWKMTPHWNGAHEHFDYQVRYSTNNEGFRGGLWTDEVKENPYRVAVVGDSYTFGFGVDDHETFVERLTEDIQLSAAFFNFGVPGYSTDQEYLLIKNRIFDLNPKKIILCVYLGNDIFDNDRPYPLQAYRAKPYFEATPGGLQLHNVPVPKKHKPSYRMQEDLMTVVMGDVRPEGRLARWAAKYEVFRLLHQRTYQPQDLAESARFAERFEAPLKLFKEIMRNMKRDCDQRYIPLHVVLLPGQSFVLRPGSPSAQYQEYLRAETVDILQDIHVPVFDMAQHLKVKSKEKIITQWFHPNDGHFTAEGHRVIAEGISAWMRQ